MNNNFYEHPDIYDIAHTEKLNEVLKEYYITIFNGKKINSIHDCSFGTGNLSFILSKIGYDLSGSDLSEKMLNKAEEKIKKEGLSIELIKCDFRKLTEKIDKKYDCVICTGNSLAHVSNNDVDKTLIEMSKLVNEKGYIYFDTRNWEKILETKQRFYYYQPIFRGDERINFMQVWDYNLDDTITFNLLYSFEKDNKIYKREEFQEVYYPFKLKFIEEKLNKLGFIDIEINNFLNLDVKEFEDMEWYSVIARKS